MRPATPPSANPPGPPGGREWRLAVWRLFLRSHAEVVQTLEQELLAAVGMPLSWYDVLRHVSEAPHHELRMSQLADRILLSRSGVTRLVARMERDDLVRRVQSRHDARGTLCVLTREGYEAFRAADPIYLRGASEQWLGRFSEDELRVMARLLSRTVTPPSPRPARP